jgi:hypothetical protein
MKKLLKNLLILIFAISFNALSQVPQGFNYQALARDASGVILSSQSVVFRISIIQGTISGSSVYSETHSVTTNQFGLVNFVIGSGVLVNGNFSSIDWAQGPYFVQIELDANSSGSFVTMSTTQLLSVPYAQYAAKSGNPILKSGIGISIQNDTIKNIGDISNQNEIQFLSISNDSLKLSQTNGGISLSNIIPALQSGSYVLSNNPTPPSGYSFTGKVEAEDCNQIVKLDTYYDQSYIDTLLGSSMFSYYKFLAVGNEIYGAGCYVAGNQKVKKFIKYNPITNDWNELPAFSKPRVGFSFISLNNKIYVIGGDSNLFQSNNHAPVPYVEEYDLNSNSWLLKADMPTSRILSVTNTINNKIYVIGGVISFNSQWLPAYANEVFDPLSNIWTQKANTPNFINVNIPAVKSSNSFFVKCYTDNSQTSQRTLRYNFTTDNWQIIQDPPNEYDPVYSLQCAGIQYADNKLSGIFYTQGFGTIYELDTLTNLWQQSYQSMMQPDYYIIKSNLCLISGFEGGTPSRVIKSYYSKNGALLCSNFLRNSPNVVLENSDNFYIISDGGPNKLGLSKYLQPNLIYKHIKN